MYRSILSALALTLTLVPLAGAATGPGGWSDLGAGAKPTFPALNGVVLSLNTDAPGVLYVGGDFTDAGGDPNADYIARWDGQAWKALGASRLTGAIHAIAYRGGQGLRRGHLPERGRQPRRGQPRGLGREQVGPGLQGLWPGVRRLRARDLRLDALHRRLVRERRGHSRAPTTSSPATSAPVQRGRSSTPTAISRAP